MERETVEVVSDIQVEGTTCRQHAIETVARGIPPYANVFSMRLSYRAVSQHRYTTNEIERCLGTIVPIHSTSFDIRIR